MINRTEPGHQAASPNRRLLPYYQRLGSQERLNQADGRNSAISCPFLSIKTTACAQALARIPTPVLKRVHRLPENQ